MFQITGAFAEFERSMIRQRVRAGLKRAVERSPLRPGLTTMSPEQARWRSLCQGGLWSLPFTTPPLGAMHRQRSAESTKHQWSLGSVFRFKHRVPKGSK